MKLCLAATLIVFGLASPAFALPCSLTDNDWASLAHPSCRVHTDCGPISEADADALPPQKQSDICQGRKYYHFVHEHLARGESAEDIGDLPEGGDFPAGLSRYVTEDEFKEMQHVISYALAKMMSN